MTERLVVESDLECEKLENVIAGEIKNTMPIVEIEIL